MIRVRIHRTRWLIALALVASLGRAAQDESLAAKRKRWSGSFLYRYSKDFILDSSCALTDSPKKVDRKALNEIRRSLKDTLNLLVAQHNASLDRAQHYFSVARRAPANTSITLTNALDEVQFDTGEENDIQVSSLAVRSMLVGLVSGKVSRALAERSGDELSSPPPTTQKVTAAIEGFCRLVQTGSASDFEKFEDHDPLYAVAIDNMDLLASYSAVLLFATAHELGHIVLSHVTPEFFASCDQRRRLELQADFYGSYLAYSLITPYELSVRGVGKTIFFPDYSDQFFDLVYNFVGFNRPDSSGCYPYPLNSQRIDVTSTARDWAKEDAPALSVQAAKRAKLYVDESQDLMIRMLFNNQFNPYRLRLLVKSGIVARNSSKSPGEQARGMIHSGCFPRFGLLRIQCHPRL